MLYQQSSQPIEDVYPSLPFGTLKTGFKLGNGSLGMNGHTPLDSSTPFIRLEKTISMKSAPGQ
jgi:hypothetical protein